MLKHTTELENAMEKMPAVHIEVRVDSKSCSGRNLLETSFR